MYDVQEWRNDDLSTPVSAQRLTHLEQGISGIGAKVETLPEPLPNAVDIAALVAKAGFTWP